MAKVYTSAEDCISRRAVLEYIEGSEAELGHSSENELVCQDIKEFPPVTPEHCTDDLQAYYIAAYLPIMVDCLASIADSLEKIANKEDKK